MQIRGGINFSASKLRGAKFQCKPLEGGAKFQCTDIWRPTWGNKIIPNENAGALARPPATCPPCHYSKQIVPLTVIFLICSKYNCSLWYTGAIQLSKFKWGNSENHMSWCHAVTSRDVTPYHHMVLYPITKSSCTDKLIWNSKNYIF